MGRDCKEAGPPAARGPKPLVNRYLLVCILCLYCLISGPTYFNWTPIADSLFKDGAYLWKCTAAELAEAAAEETVSYAPRCAAQELAVNNLFAVSSASHFFCSFFGGVSLDLFGPKVTAVAGTSLMILGWVLMAVSNASFCAYTAAAVFIGMSVDTSFFPCLSAANLFPKNSSTVIAIFGCFRSLAFVVPLAFRAAVVQSEVASSKQAMLVYACLFVVLCLLTGLVLLPKRPFEKQEQQEGGSAAAGDSSEETIAVDAAAAGDSSELSLSFRAKAAKELKAFSVDCCSAAYLPLIPLFCFLLTNVIFFIPSASHLMPAAYKANQIIQTFSFLPCPLLGFVADKVGIMPVMHFLNICGILIYVCVIIPGIPAYTGLQFLASVLAAVQSSFLLSQLYCYAAETFNQKNMGRLIGLVCAVAGLVSLATGEMREFALRKGFMPMCILAISFGCANAAILVFLHILKVKQKRIKVHATTNNQKTEPVAAV